MAPERLESIEQLDAQLVAVARQEAGTRLRLGQVLEVMQRKACCFELGFSSLGAYALERCERTARWVETPFRPVEQRSVLPELLSALDVVMRELPVDAGRVYVTGQSMGMSADYETAVMLGATHVRVGSALFA